jgi:hypothetical protein
VTSTYGPAGIYLIPTFSPATNAPNSSNVDMTIDINIKACVYNIRTGFLYHKMEDIFTTYFALPYCLSTVRIE